MSLSQRPGTAPPTLARAGFHGLRRQNTRSSRYIAPKLFVVAVDGSRMGYRAVRYAVWLADVSDKIKLISVEKEGDGRDMEAAKNVQDGESLLRQCGFPSINIKPGEVLQTKGRSLAETLSTAAAGGHLVMGSGGKSADAKPKKDITAGALLGSVTQDCIACCKAPVIVAKPKSTPKLDNQRFNELRFGGASSTVCVCVDTTMISQKCFDMTVRMVRKGDMVKVIHVTNTDQHAVRPGAANSLLGDSAVATYYSQECTKAKAQKRDVSFEFVQIRHKESVPLSILNYTENVCYADLIIMGSQVLAEKEADALGSVCAKVAKKTEAHILIAKHFATMFG